MALSDEDYGILFNCIASDFEFKETRQELITIQRNYKTAQDSPCALTVASMQQLEDFAVFIILSEGRELP